ncbi:MAG: SH3 domain-containing protein [Cyanobacteriota bacterium]|nr:SH3 domain-containing protein [Cyanobacteriota bacterium]
MARTFQVILGMIVGLIVLASAGAAAGYYFFSRLSTTPPKPLFSEETPEPQTEPPASSVKAEASTPAVKAETPEEETPEPQKSEELKPGEYKARVTWPDGLSLRDGPNLEAERIGGIGYDEELIVIEDSDDGRWQKVRTPGSDRQGWVKAGNVEKSD